MIQTGTTNNNACIVNVTYTYPPDPLATLVGYLRFFEWQHAIITASPLHPEKVGQGIWSCHWCGGERPNHEDFCCWNKIAAFINTLSCSPELEA